jgi:hypothetical protein
MEHANQNGTKIQCGSEYSAVNPTAMSVTVNTKRNQVN